MRSRSIPVRGAPRRHAGAGDAYAPGVDELAERVPRAPDDGVAVSEEQQIEVEIE